MNLSKLLKKTFLENIFHKQNYNGDKKLGMLYTKQG